MALDRLHSNQRIAAQPNLEVNVIGTLLVVVVEEERRERGHQTKGDQEVKGLVTTVQTPRRLQARHKWRPPDRDPYVCG